MKRDKLLIQIISDKLELLIDWVNLWYLSKLNERCSDFRLEKRLYMRPSKYLAIF